MCISKENKWRKNSHFNENAFRKCLLTKDNMTDRRVDYAERTCKRIKKGMV